MKKALISLLCAGLAAAAMAPGASAAVKAGETTYTNSFSSEADLADWEAYYVPEAGSSETASIADNWVLSNGGIKRVNDITEGAGTKNIAVLTLKDLTFQIGRAHV